MLCKLCGRDVPGKFYLHLNSSHKMRKGEYLEKFPEQAAEYDSQVPKDGWNKGATKETNSSVALGAAKVAAYARRADVRRILSERMKESYRDGDIVSPETRARIVQAGTRGWVEKVRSASDEERREILAAFTQAGNKRQEELREDRTPEDFQRLYPWAKGMASWGQCSMCEKQMIVWIGGKPRPKKRFCGESCRKEYQRLHPYFTFGETGKRYYSAKMNCEFFLRSKLEIWFAEQLDECERVQGWGANPCAISYEFDGKMRVYHPDFLVNGHSLVELKSGYVYEIDKEKTEAKLKAARRYAIDNGLEFVYWQFNENNMSATKFAVDARVKSFLTGDGRYVEQ